MTKTNYAVSEDTQALIKCMDSLNQHWGEMRNVLCKIYSDKDASDLMVEKYNPAFDNLKRVLQGFVMDSIENHMGDIDFKEI